MHDGFGNQTFQRGQVEHALWHALYRNRGLMPASWSNWVRRLLDIDRHDRGVAKSGLEVARYAFIDEVPAGAGVDHRFSAFNAFCLGVAIEMSDAGFAQSEIIFLIRHIRTKLERIFSQCLNRPMKPHQRVADDEDERHWMVLERIHLHKPMTDSQGRAVKGAHFSVPTFASGAKALMVEIQNMGHSYRKAYIQEFSRLVLDLNQTLQVAPVVKRGRKS